MFNNSASVLGLLLEAEGVQPFFKRFKSNDDNRGIYLEQLIQRGSSVLRFRSGEIRAKLWELPRIINALDIFLQDKSHKIKFTFTKRLAPKNKNPQGALNKLKEENPNLVALAKQHPDQIEFYFYSKRFKQHCQVNDTGDIILEQYNHANRRITEKWVDVVFNYKNLSELWIKHFEESLKSKDVMVINVA